jgi:hypothetical protein
VVALVDPGGDPGPGCCLGGELLHRAELELQDRVPGFDDRVVQRGPGSAHRLAGAQPLAGRAEGARGDLLNLYAAGRLKLDELITRRYALADVNQAYADMRSGVNIRGAVDFIPAG